MKKIFSTDVVFLHAPSVYDFRRDTIFFGPISDVVPSSPAFEMYPMGITSLAETLEKNGYNVRIVNLAYLMLRDPDFDPEKLIARLKPRLFAIDLHWLPHAHGSLEVAQLCKKYHPNIPVAFGGLSSSYYHEELISYPYVDFVLRGDSTEEPMRQLVSSLRQGQADFSSIPNLTWKKPDGQPVVNPLTWIPDNLDYTTIPSYRYVMGSVFKYGSLHNTMPYLDWLSYPITALLTARGCTQNCSICGGSRSAYARICGRQKPAYRSPKALVEDIRFIKSFGKAPIFILHDIRQAGMDYAREFFGLLKKERIPNELIIELFFPADEEYFRLISESVPRFSLELTIETHEEHLRRLNGKFKCSNAAVEATIAAALKYNCRKIDLFFMTGIPGQTYQSALASIDYCRQLLEKFDGDKRLSLFIAPLAPFLDPGSPAFENPEKYGYIKHCQTLEDHRQALTRPSWKHILSYETTTMSRDEIVDATYEAAYRLNELKREYNLIPEEVYEDIRYRITQARQIIAEIDRILLIPDEEVRQLSLQKLKARVAELNRHTICGKDELKWPLGRRFAGLWSLGKLLTMLFLEEVKRVGLRLRGNYDQHPLEMG
ncbi:MAG: TIGR04190 family B12-binding domain/radical SAM domain protein [Bacillota bacterium]